MKIVGRQTLIEWGFVAFLLALCAILTVLQYSWTGEVSRAEADRLRLTLTEQAQSMADAFDTELSQSCAALTPSRTELRELQCAEAFAVRLRDWRAMNPLPIFRRVAVAVPSNSEVNLFGGDETTGRARPMEWPQDWGLFREFVARMSRGGRPGLDDRTGEFLEFPIFGGRISGGPGSGERGWLLVQLDLDYIRSTWFPELIRSHLSLGKALPYDVTVTAAATQQILFTTKAGNSSAGDIVFTTRFHRDGLPALRVHGVELPGRRTNKGGGLWSLEIRQRPAALEALVSASRRRNLGIALLVNGLIIAAGVALVFHTRRSRQLAQQQMNFVATVTHELRTPLTVIRGAGHNLLRGIVKERTQIEEYSRMIIQNAEHLGEMVEQTLALAGADKVISTGVREEVNLSAVLKEAIHAVAEDTRTAQCEVHLNLPPVLPPVCGDASAFRRVFQNLITNAARHGGEGRWIGVNATSASVHGSSVVEISVVDRGQGIPESEQKEIFRPFYRGRAARMKPTRGSGLGLSVVKETVLAHGGSVEVESKPGQGTRFTVRIPTLT